MKLLTMPHIDLSLAPLNLMLPTLGNCGGYRVPSLCVSGEPIPAYSPIDLTICGLTALRFGEQSITDLNKWFIHNPDSIAEIWVTCTCIKISEVYNDLIETYSITGWKGFCKYDINLKNLFKMNAPFTFRNL